MLCSVVDGFVFSWLDAGESVHESAGVVPVDPGRVDRFTRLPRRVAGRSALIAYAQYISVVRACSRASTVSESVAVGTPVVLSNQGSMAEIGRDGGAEFVNPYKVGEIADAMLRLFMDDEYLDRLRGEARARVLPTWDWLVDGVGTGNSLGYSVTAKRGTRGRNRPNC